MKKTHSILPEAFTRPSFLLLVSLSACTSAYGQQQPQLSAERAYSSVVDRSYNAIEARGVVPTIPALSNKNAPRRAFDTQERLSSLRPGTIQAYTSKGQSEPLDHARLVIPQQSIAMPLSLRSARRLTASTTPAFSAATKAWASVQLPAGPVVVAPRSGMSITAPRIGPSFLPHRRAVRGRPDVETSSRFKAPKHTW